MTLNSIIKTVIIRLKMNNKIWKEYKRQSNCFKMELTFKIDMIINEMIQFT